MIAKLYRVAHPIPLYQVVYCENTKEHGRRKRIRRHFANKGEAEEYQRTLNERLTLEGTAGLAFDAILRTDAIAARQKLNVADRSEVTLLEVATRYLAELAPRPESVKAKEALAAFLEEKEAVEGCAERTVRTLRNRLEAWLDRSGVRSVEDITRGRVEEIRIRPGASQQTRRNDMAALSAWCSWLLDKGFLPHHPLRGLKRPKLPPAKRETFSAAECGQLLQAARAYFHGKWLGTIAVMVWTGCRPSEIPETRLLYGRPAVARIEGGKLKGRANRTVPLSPAALAWLAAVGKPSQVEPINSKARRRIAERAGLKWTADVTRHTYISNRLALVKNDAQVAREAGTSEAMIHRHYHSLKLAKEARAWAGLRP